MTTRLDKSDVGKRVVNEHGDDMGVLVGIRDGTGYVDPDTGLTETIKTKLGWDSIDDEDYPIPEESIETITDDEIRLVLD